MIALHAQLSIILIKIQSAQKLVIHVKNGIRLTENVFHAGISIKLKRGVVFQKKLLIIKQFQGMLLLKLRIKIAKNWT